MIKTGLPYNMGDMDEIKNHGAIVDMSDIQFPNITADKKQRTTFIFLRNTGFDVSLDFSNCSFEDKEAFLIRYLSESIEVKQEEFPLSYIKILNRISGNDIEIPCILNDDEIVKFIENNNDLLINIFRLVKSLPLFAMHCFTLNGTAYDMDEFEKTDDVPFNDNIYNIISNQLVLTLFDNDLDIPPVFYNKLFTFENKRMIQVIDTQLPFFSILFGLSTTDKKDWETIIEKSNSLELEHLENNPEPV